MSLANSRRVCTTQARPVDVARLVAGVELIEISANFPAPANRYPPVTLASSSAMTLPLTLARLDISDEFFPEIYLPFFSAGF
jgi:hypothetical protein